MAANVWGRLDWSSSATREGHREHRLVWLVGSLISDGPFDIYFATGLPVPGSPWVYGNTNDPWAFCAPDWKIAPFEHQGEPNYLWTVEQTFTTIPRRRCQDDSVEDPLLEPDDISGTFIKYQMEVTRDRFGDPIKSSSHEMIRGKLVERDFNRPTVRIKKNLASLPLSTFAPMIDHVNDATLWGLPARCVKLSNVTWQRSLYAVCNYFYTVTYDFDISYDTFDVEIQDEGSKCLIGYSPGSDQFPLDPDGTDAETGGLNKDNPKNFENFLDIHGNPARCLLDAEGDGTPWDGVDSPGVIDVEHYNEANLLLLDIPTSL